MTLFTLCIAYYPEKKLRRDSSNLLILTALLGADDIAVGDVESNSYPSNILVRSILLMFQLLDMLSSSASIPQLTGPKLMIPIPTYQICERG